MIEKLADKIKDRLLIYCKGHGYEIVIPNFFMSLYEMDMFRLMQSGFVIEYEIKISKSDFKADFEKGTTNWRGEKIEGGKHEDLKGGKRICNRFFFVAPEGIIDVKDVPEYAGLIVYKNDTLHMVKNAPLLHKRKATDDKNLFKNLAERLSFREEHVRHKYRSVKRELYRVKKELIKYKNGI